MRLEKVPWRVSIYVDGYRIDGKIHLPPGGRLTDFLNAPGRIFLPITDAKVYDEKTNVLIYSPPLMEVNQEHIKMLYLVPGERSAEEIENDVHSHRSSK